MVIKVHLTPRERERLIRQERERRRIARLRQVRQQSNENAQLIRQKLCTNKKSKVKELRKELRRSISEKMSEVESDVMDIPMLPLPSNSFALASPASKEPTKLCTSRRRHIFTKADAVRALERGRLAQERFRAERLARRKKAEEAIRLKRRAVEEANEFNKASSTTH